MLSISIQKYDPSFFITEQVYDKIISIRNSCVYKTPLKKLPSTTKTKQKPFYR